MEEAEAKTKKAEEQIEAANAALRSLSGSCIPQAIESIIFLHLLKNDYELWVARTGLEVIFL